jgi:hypothetical protein
MDFDSKAFKGKIVTLEKIFPRMNQSPKLKMV